MLSSRTASSLGGGRPPDRSIGATPPWPPMIDVSRCSTPHRTAACAPLASSSRRCDERFAAGRASWFSGAQVFVWDEEANAWVNGAVRGAKGRGVYEVRRATRSSRARADEARDAPLGGRHRRGLRDGAAAALCASTRCLRGGVSPFECAPQGQHRARTGAVRRGRRGHVRAARRWRRRRRRGGQHGGHVPRGTSRCSAVAPVRRIFSPSASAATSRSRPPDKTPVEANHTARRACGRAALRRGVDGDVAAAERAPRKTATAVDERRAAAAPALASRAAGCAARRRAVPPPRERGPNARSRHGSSRSRWRRRRATPTSARMLAAVLRRWRRRRRRLHRARRRVREWPRRRGRGRSLRASRTPLRAIAGWTSSHHRAAAARRRVVEVECSEAARRRRSPQPATTRSSPPRTAASTLGRDDPRRAPRARRAARAGALFTAAWRAPATVAALCRATAARAARGGHLLVRARSGEANAARAAEPRLLAPRPPTDRRDWRPRVAHAARVAVRRHRARQLAARDAC